MSSYIEYKLPFIFSSSPDAGAKNISADGSGFEVLLDRPIIIPRDAINCFITVQNSTAWWNVFNIKEGINDQIDVEYTNLVPITLNFTITVEAGLYDMTHLTEEIGRELLANGVPQDLFTLIPDQATQKSVIQFNYPLTQVDFNIPRNFAEILGFNERLVPLLVTSGVQFEKSDNIANFNTIDYLLIHSDLVSRGIMINDKYQNVISQLLIDVSPGSQITDSPFNPPNTPTPELVGEKRKNISFWITDQNNVRINTQGELFSVRLIIHYYMKMKE